jgi:quercetin dioxygenase-like cupin family protein
VDRRSLLVSIGAILAQSARSQSASNKSVFQHDLPDIDIKNWAVNAAEITYAPGGVSSAHSHPGITLVYVLEGEIVSSVGGGPEQTYSPGQMFIETPNQLHGVSRNASKTQPAKFLAILMAEKGKPLTKPA